MPPVSRADDRTLAGHGLEDRRAESLGDRTHDKQIERLHQGQNILAESGERDVMRQAEVLDLMLECLTQFAVADNDEAGVRDLVNDQRRRGHQMALTLVRRQCRDIADKRRAVGEPERAMGVNGRLPIDGRQVHAVVHDLDAIDWDAVLLENRRDEARGGDEHVHVAVLPSRERVPLQVKVDAPRGDHERLGERALHT